MAGVLPPDVRVLVHLPRNLVRGPWWRHLAGLKPLPEVWHHLLESLPRTKEVPRELWRRTGGVLDTYVWKLHIPANAVARKLGGGKFPRVENPAPDHVPAQLLTLLMANWEELWTWGKSREIQRRLVHLRDEWAPTEEDVLALCLAK